MKFGNIHTLFMIQRMWVQTLSMPNSGCALHLRRNSTEGEKICSTSYLKNTFPSTDWSYKDLTKCLPSRPTDQSNMF